MTRKIWHLVTSRIQEAVGEVDNRWKQAIPTSLIKPSTRMASAKHNRRMLGGKRCRRCRCHRHPASRHSCKNKIPTILQERERERENSFPSHFLPSFSYPFARGKNGRSIDFRVAINGVSFRRRAHKSPTRAGAPRRRASRARERWLCRRAPRELAASRARHELFRIIIWKHRASDATRPPLFIRRRLFIHAFVKQILIGIRRRRDERRNRESVSDIMPPLCDVSPPVS